MIVGPWYLNLRPGGYAVRAKDRTLIAEFTGAHVSMADHRRNAQTVTYLPDMIEALVMAESYFGDRPSGDEAARRIHARLIDVMTQAGIETEADKDK